MSASDHHLPDSDPDETYLEFPPGWVKEWNSQYSAWYYVDTTDPAHPKSQWTPPTGSHHRTSDQLLHVGPAPGTAHLDASTNAAAETAVQAQSLALGETIESSIMDGVDKGSIAQLVQNSGMADSPQFKSVLERLGLGDVLGGASGGVPDGEMKKAAAPGGPPPAPEKDEKGHSKWTYALGGAAAGALADSLWEKHKRTEAFQEGLPEGHREEMAKAKRLHQELNALQAKNAELEHQRQLAQQQAQAAQYQAAQQQAYQPSYQAAYQPNYPQQPPPNPYKEPRGLLPFLFPGTRLALAINAHEQRRDDRRDDRRERREDRRQDRFERHELRREERWGRRMDRRAFGGGIL